MKQIRANEVSARATAGQTFVNLSLRPATVRAELIPKGVAVFNPDGSKTLERIPQNFEASRAVLDVTNATLVPFWPTEAHIDHQINFLLLSPRAVYVYRIKWLVEGQGEIASSCLRIPVWKQGAAKVFPKDSNDIKCE